MKPDVNLELFIVCQWLLFKVREKWLFWRPVFRMSSCRFPGFINPGVANFYDPGVTFCLKFYCKPHVDYHSTWSTPEEPSKLALVVCVISPDVQTDAFPEGRELGSQLLVGQGALTAGLWPGSPGARSPVRSAGQLWRRGRNAVWCLGDPMSS